ncbi:hypothetical protein M441DRAFT_322934 [Trichoderma asperellum CBS 433.97]|uniref:Uncharacterized protein n=1 Tax=Trichoderma asperellum (strain ATCC 204424 / CBS 433.97 / NBRC 101777) TaxID=1042311 RepID=A0A2T3ZLL4_TRIA4|nr:hypothetical protein M441DRAFT_322934 [Trichoderma asperellum CBS 433.97]PTB45691.1 hypothetical protein M441DRAFT_322934 [Trichoderma asperellum CBS 433.97]
MSCFHNASLIPLKPSLLVSVTSAEYCTYSAALLLRNTEASPVSPSAIPMSVWGRSERFMFHVSRPRIYYQALPSNPAPACTATIAQAQASYLPLLVLSLLILSFAASLRYSHGFSHSFAARTR